MIFDENARRSGVIRGVFFCFVDIPVDNLTTELLPTKNGASPYFT